MKSLNLDYKSNKELKQFISKSSIKNSSNLLIQVFCSVNNNSKIEKLLSNIVSILPNSILIGATSRGEIIDGEVLDEKIIINFTDFQHTNLKLTILKNIKNSAELGKRFSKEADTKDLKAVITFACGLEFNGDEFLQNVSFSNDDVVIAGGVAGSIDTHQSSFIFTKDEIIENGIVSVSLSSKVLNVYNDYSFNWQKVGKRLKITKAKGNRVYEIDGKKAVDVFSYYLGERIFRDYFEQIGSEFSLMIDRHGVNIARSIMSEHKDGSLTFSGNFKDGDDVYFAFGNVKDILKKSFKIAKNIQNHPVEAIFVYSCVARKMFLKEDINCETMPLGQIAPTCGFFTHGEFFTAKNNEFLNQTMTVLTLSEDQKIKKSKLKYKELKNGMNPSNEALFHLINVANAELSQQTLLVEKQKNNYEKLFEKSSNGLLIIKNKRIIRCNQKAIEILGRSSMDELLDPKKFKFTLDIQPNGENSATKAFEFLRLSMEHGEYYFEWKIKKQNNQEAWIDVSLVPIAFEDAEVITYAILRDITKQKEAQIKLKESNVNFKNYLDAIDNINTGLFVVSENFVVEYMNDTMKRWFGDQVNKVCYSDVGGIKDPCPYCQIDKVIKNKEIVRYQPRTADGRTFDIVATPLVNPDGSVSKMEVIRNITKEIELRDKLKEQQDDLNYQARHDALTGLPNRFDFDENLNIAIKRAQNTVHQFALFVVDLDRFKKVNDSLGHKIGDKLLQEIATKIRHIIDKHSYFARIGGDEFAIILENLEDAKQASQLANKIIEELKEPLVIEDQTFYMSCSVGISIFPQDSKDAQGLLRNADSAMYQAKNQGRSTYQFASLENSKMVLEYFELERNLRKALENEEFEVYYQPQIDGRTGTLIGMEALIRWIHPVLGVISPMKFIPVAEEMGLITLIDRWVMKSAFKDVLNWYEKGYNPGTLALNLAMQHLQAEDFVDMLSQTIKQMNFKAQWLELEITESQIMSNPKEVIKTLREVSRMGIRLAVDDFGTGYSSLAYLKRFPINKLKIDQSFVRELPQNQDDASIVKTIIALADNLNLKSIAEGVETQEQKDFLIENGCSDIQGYLYSKPLKAKEFEEKFLKN